MSLFYEVFSFTLLQKQMPLGHLLYGIKAHILQTGNYQIEKLSQFYTVE